MGFSNSPITSRKAGGFVCATIRGVVMKPLLILTMTMALVWSDAALAERVRGYTRKDGTYVQPHVRTRANDRLYDNYSSQGNYSPTTGREGTRDPFAAPSFNSYEDQGGSSRRSRKKSAW